MRALIDDEFCVVDGSQAAAAPLDGFDVILSLGNVLHGLLRPAIS